MTKNSDSSLSVRINEKEYVMEKKTPNDVVYIDFRTIWNLLKRKFFVLIAAGLLGALLFGAFGYLTYTPLYSSTVSLIVHAEETTTNQLTAYDVTYSEKLINTLEVFLKHNNDFRQQLGEMAGTSDMYTASEMLEIMEVSQIKTSTPTMDVTFTSESRNAAYNLAKSFELLVNDELERLSVSVGSVGILNSATLSDKAINSNPMIRDAAIGFVIGFVLLFIIFLVKVALDTKIHNELDITELFDYPLLGSVPSFHGRTKKSGYGKKNGYGYGSGYGYGYGYGHDHEAGSNG